MNQGRPRTPKTAEQLLDLAREQFDFILNSAEGYDDGRLSEAKRLAVHMRVLLHDTNQSHALLKQTEHLDRLKFLDSGGDFIPGNFATESTLVLTRMSFSETGGSAVHLPKLGDGPPPWQPPMTVSQQLAALRAGTKPFRRAGTHVEFDRWWNAPVVRDIEGTLFTRRRLVLALANEEGGAHVDPGTRADYEALANNNSLGWVFGSDWEMESGAGSPLGSPVPACVRQIAWEVHTTVFNQAPDLLPAAAQKVPPPKKFPTS
nr:hypothetical protein [uncultured Nocardioides sp.]